MDFCPLFCSQLPVRCCAVGMVNTLKVVACATAAGRAPNVMFPPASASTSRAVAMGPALGEPASATLDTKGRTAKKVLVLNVTLTCLNVVKFHII